jgi:hypothetical protein
MEALIRQRSRKLVGCLVMLVFVPAYVLVAGAIADQRLADAGTAARFIYFIVAGLVWILPLMPLIRWMERPDAPRRP